MDWVQWYLFCVITIMTGFSLCLHGTPRDQYDFREYFLGLLIALPYIGRVFQWW